MDKSVKQVIIKYDKPGDVEPGDIFITNDPYTGGVTHLNAVILVMPVFTEGEIVAWTANIAHWNDVGGAVPGSMSTNATEIFQEGMILSAIKLFSKGQPIRSVFDILTANCRMPDFLTGDLWAGVASVRVGERRVMEIVNKYGKDVFLRAVEEYLDYGKRVSLNAIKRLPKGVYELVEPQDNGPDYKVRVEITDNEFIIDLRDNPDQDKGTFNMSRDETITACQIAFKGVTSPERNANGGTFRPLKVLTRHGSVFDPIYPAAMGFTMKLLFGCTTSSSVVWLKKCPIYYRRVVLLQCVVLCLAEFTRILEDLTKSLNPNWEAGGDLQRVTVTQGSFLLYMVKLTTVPPR